MEKNLDRYSRQMRFPGVGEEGQRRIAASRVTLVGCGALGSALADGLVRAGVGFVRIVDRDFLELNNLQRQHLYDEQDLADNLPKAEAAARKLRRINRDVAIEPVVSDLDHQNIDALCSGADVILDGTDNFETRFLINEWCVKSDTPWVHGACVGAEGRSMTIVPGETACFRCLVESAPPPGMSPTCETAGILASASTLVAAFQLAEAIKILVGAREAISRDLFVIDLWNNTTRRLRLTGLPERAGCPVCQHRRFDYLGGKSEGGATTLCGRNAVQVRPAARFRVDFAALERRLAPLGAVTSNAYLLRAAVDGVELSVFPDGRAIVKGTDDPALARSLYARYVGG